MTASNKEARAEITVLLIGTKVSVLTNLVLVLLVIPVRVHMCIVRVRARDMRDDDVRVEP